MTSPATSPAFAVVVFTAHPEPTPEPTPTAGSAAHAFIKVDGREAFLKSIDPFLNREHVRQLVACFTPDFIDQAKTKYGSHLMFVGVKVATGSNVFDQLASAMTRLLPEITHVIVHDGARCAVPSIDIDQLLEAGLKHDAVALTSPVNSQVIEFDIDHPDQPVRTLHASGLRHLLFPQVYSRQVFAEVCSSRTFPSLGQLKLLEGHPLNVRLNHPDEAALVKSLIQLLPKPKSTGPISPFEEAQW